MAGALAVLGAALGMMATGSESSATGPLETLTTPEGTVINVYTTRVHAADVYQTLLANGLQPWIGLARVDVVDTGLTMAAVGGGTSRTADGNVTYFASPAVIQLNANDFLAHPNASIGHEYGHVWANYYLWTYWQASWDSYLQARGLAGDPRLGSGSCWYPSEIIADDYRDLFAAPETTPGVIVVGCTGRPAASAVVGLEEFLANVWTNGHPPANHMTDPATPAPVPTATRTPVPSASPTPAMPTPVPATPTRTPTAAAPTPSSPAQATVQLGKGWSSFVAPISGSTNVVVYASSGKKAAALHRVAKGSVYWAKGPVTVTITGP